MWQLNPILISLSLNILLVYANDATEEPTTTSAEVKTANPLPSCNGKNENINDCLLKVFAEIIPRSKYGIPELNMPPMDPLLINKTSYIFSHPFVDGKVTVRNLNVYGVSNQTIKSLNYKRKGDEVHLTLKVHIPKLFVEGLYRSKIKINTFNITSRGPFNVSLSNIDATLQIVSDLVAHDGHRYFSFKSFNFDPTVGNMKINAEGLMPEPLLNDAIIEFLNQNWRSIYKSLIPETRAAWEPEILKLSRQLFSGVTIDAVLKEE